MKAVKMNVELQRQLEEAEREIAKKKAEEAKKTEETKTVKPKKAPIVSVPMPKMPSADDIVEKSKSTLEKYGGYFALVAIVLAITLFASLFAISSGKTMIAGVGGSDSSSGEIFVGVLMIIFSLFAPAGFVGVSYVTSGHKGNSLLYLVPMILGFMISLLFLFIV